MMKEFTWNNIGSYNCLGIYVPDSFYYYHVLNDQEILVCNRLRYWNEQTHTAQIHFYIRSNDYHIFVGAFDNFDLCNLYYSYDNHEIIVKHKWTTNKVSNYAYFLSKKTIPDLYRIILKYI